MFDAIRKWWKKSSCDFSFNDAMLRQQTELNSLAADFAPFEAGIVKLCEVSSAYGKKIEEISFGNGLVKRFVVDDAGVVRDTGRKLNSQRCKYCGCLVSSFDTHCKSCGAPI